MELQQQILAKKKKLVYYAKISKMGSKKMVIIPKAYWDDIKDLEDAKQIKITLEDIED